MNGTAESACLVYKHMYLPDGAIRGAAVALTTHQNPFSSERMGRGHTRTLQSCVGVIPWQQVAVLFPERLTLLVSSGLISVSCTSCSSSIFLLSTVNQPVRVGKRKTTHSTLLFYNLMLQTDLRYFTIDSLF